MITKATTEILEMIRRKSDEIYDQGGTTYEYRFAKNLAHYLIPLEFKSLDSIWREGEEKLLSDKEIAEVTFVVDGAIGNPVVRDEGVSPEAMSLTSQLLEGLQSDTQYKQIFVGKLSKSPDDSGEELILVMTCENDFFSLEISWTID